MSIFKDGTLVIQLTDKDYNKVKRVLVEGEKCGTLYYPDDKPKRGHWILQDPEGVWTNNYMCSRCGGMVLSCKLDLPKYCSHCGSKM